MDSKKLLLLSDTHGNITALKTVLRWANDHVPPNDTICSAAFLGDGISDLRPASDAAGFSCNWALTGGNNDYGYQSEAGVFDFGENRFFMCHGHRHSLYGGYHTLIASARNNGANAALFGHSHVPLLKYADGIFLINPGSVGNPRSKIGASFAVIECAAGKPLQVEFWGINKGEIQKLII
ncbi:MAG: YfcE family phosphodiesterase [Treponema sp.]|nr:YfcE family phosphodiesterase [Treponema sp.]